MLVHAHSMLRLIKERLAVLLVILLARHLVSHGLAGGLLAVGDEIAVVSLSAFAVIAIRQ